MQDNQPSKDKFKVVVDYKTCESCGFRLMRVEPFIDKGKLIQVETCPICGLRRDEGGYVPGKVMSPQERSKAFDNWLSRNGLNRDVLEQRYYLSADIFFSY